MDNSLSGSPAPVPPVVDANISLSSSSATTESESTSPRTEPDPIPANMRMIEDPVLTLCHFPSPGSNLQERKKVRVLPCVSLSLLCFSPPTATSPPTSPLLHKRHSLSPPDSDCCPLDKLQKGLSPSFHKIEDSLNTPVTHSAAGTGFFGSSVVPILDPPPIGMCDFVCF